MTSYTRTKIDTVPGRTIIVSKGDGFKDTDNMKDALELVQELGASPTNPIGIDIYSGKYIEDNSIPLSVPKDGSVRVRGFGVVIIQPEYTDRQTFDERFPQVINCRIIQNYNGNQEIFGITCRSPTVVQVCSISRTREEVWSLVGDDVWILVDAIEAFVLSDSFIAPAVLIPGLLGLNSQIPWAVNGRANGAVAPAEANFVAANDIGGGLILRVLAGGQDNDYTAIHFGNNYPLALSEFPQVCMTVDFEAVADVGYFTGMADDSRATGTNVFVLPDNCVAFYMDTDTGDNHIHCIIRSGGAYLLNEDLGPAPPGNSYGCIRRNPVDNKIEFILRGVIVAEYDDLDFPTDQLQPYAAVIGRAAGLAANADLHIHGMKLIMNK